MRNWGCSVVIKKRMLLALMTLGLGAGLLGCTLGQEELQEEELLLYFAAPESKIGGAAVESEPYDSQDTPSVESLVTALLAGPQEDSDLTSVIPNGVELISWSLEDYWLELELSEEYSTLSGVDLTVADYCLTLTLCQLEEVNGVSILVNHETIIGRSIQEMVPEDIILSGAEDESVYLNVVLWFPNESLQGLSVETREISLTQKDNVAEVILEALLEGPSYGDRLDIGPEDTSLLSATVDNDVCLVDLSEEFMEENGINAKALLNIYSIANTLCGTEYATIDQVLFFVEGEPLDYYGAINLSDGITPLYELETS